MLAPLRRGQLCFYSREHLEMMMSAVNSDKLLHSDLERVTAGPKLSLAVVLAALHVLMNAVFNVSQPRI